MGEAMQHHLEGLPRNARLPEPVLLPQDCRRLHLLHEGRLVRCDVGLQCGNVHAAVRPARKGEGLRVVQETHRLRRPPHRRGLCQQGRDLGLQRTPARLLVHLWQRLLFDGGQQLIQLLLAMRRAQRNLRGHGGLHPGLDPQLDGGSNAGELHLRQALLNTREQCTFHVADAHLAVAGDGFLDLDRGAVGALGQAPNGGARAGAARLGSLSDHLPGHQGDMLLGIGHLGVSHAMLGGQRNMLDEQRVVVALDEARDRQLELLTRLLVHQRQVRLG
mmetsp:Transcript_128965/g.413040  ORF Transcript_128965/g.413040 Transcript_128965/m.413040 type:complete len:275 (-) Transcript_128965:637-1461(-)